MLSPLSPAGLVERVLVYLHRQRPSRCNSRNGSCNLFLCADEAASERLVRATALAGWQQLRSQVSDQPVGDVTGGRPSSPLRESASTPTSLLPHTHNGDFSLRAVLCQFALGSRGEQPFSDRIVADPYFGKEARVAVAVEDHLAPVLMRRAVRTVRGCEYALVLAVVNTQGLAEIAHNVVPGR